MFLFTATHVKINAVKNKNNHNSTVAAIVSSVYFMYRQWRCPIAIESICSITDHQTRSHRPDQAAKRVFHAVNVCACRPLHLPLSTISINRNVALLDTSWPFTNLLVTFINTQSHGHDQRKQVQSSSRKKIKSKKLCIQVIVDKI